MANNETRTFKTNTFEEWRQKTNEQSFELGDVDQLDSRILDKNYTYTAAADQAQFTGTDTGSKTLRFEQAPEEAVDMLHVVSLLVVQLYLQTLLQELRVLSLVDSLVRSYGLIRIKQHLAQ